LHAERTFFGVYRVRTDPDQPFVSLWHGTTIHGRQAIGDANPEPLTYFHRNSPIGQIFATLGAEAGSVGVIGLGTGTLAAYAQPGSRWIFYEIDEAVERIARDTRYFHYLEHCGAQCSVVIGDARLTLSASDAAHDVLVLDAFSSDAIPVHLLTKEALRTYEARLSTNGVLAFHISNRHINLAPAMARLAREQGLAALRRVDKRSDFKRGFEGSEWVVMARRPQRLQQLAADARWTPLVADARPAWTDDFSNIWTELR
jgi:spermidine synthase